MEKKRENRSYNHPGRYLFLFSMLIMTILATVPNSLIAKTRVYTSGKSVAEEMSSPEINSTGNPAIDKIKAETPSASCRHIDKIIKVHSENPHYFYYEGKPIILLTSDHTYFGVTAADFDYVKFLDKLAAYGNNFTRIYPGPHPVNYTNQPRIFPWKLEKNGEYNLDIWNEDYFKRLHGFMSYAQSKGIIVDIVLFNGFGSDKNHTYQWRWNWSPLKDSNNVQVGVGTKRDYFCTLEEPALVNYEKAYVKKIVTELNQYNNLIYDVADEPDFFGMISDSLVNPWISAMMDVIINTEATLEKKHLVAETLPSYS